MKKRNYYYPTNLSYLEEYILKGERDDIEEINSHST